jgi:fructose-bisphosphate aldolase class II
MARITLRQLLDDAAEHGYGVPAFNINNMEQALAIMEAAAATDAPVILQASRGARAYVNDIMLKHMMDAVTEIYPNIPVCVHLDHGNEPSTCVTAIQHGFTSVMMDGSILADGKTAADWDYNVKVTRSVSDTAHWAGRRRSWCRRQARSASASDRSGGSREVCRRDQGGCACRRNGHQPWRLQVLTPAGR